MAVAQPTGTRPAHAFSPVLELAAGYDDNARLDSEPQGSAFTTYRLGLQHGIDLSSSELELGLYANGSYQDYFRVSDKYQLSMGGELSTSLAQGRLRPALLSELSFYRDELIEEDAHNSILAGIRLQWLLSGRLTLEASQLWSWQDYTDFQSPLTGRVRGYGQQVASNSFQKRDDSRQSTEIQSIFYLLPDLETSLSLHHATHSSSIALEEYERWGGQMAVAWLPAEGLTVSGSIALGQNDYSHPPDGINREDNNYMASLRLGYDVGLFELFLDLSQQENDSTLTGEDYKQTVTQCGFSFSL